MQLRKEKLVYIQQLAHTKNVKHCYMFRLVS